jgi:hypothetical protein
MCGKAVVMGAHHSVLAALPHFLLIGSNGRAECRLRRNTLLLDLLLLNLLGKSGRVMDGVVEALATVLEKKLSVAWLIK